ncbi:hypothetical protein M3Y99_01305700 [Aphelenchoides fujianensis]|nr:hypothetical protein M3Y99_01305700 [Aphelenchoides fujianensis]
MATSSAFLCLFVFAIAVQLGSSSLVGTLVNLPKKLEVFLTAEALQTVQQIPPEKKKIMQDIVNEAGGQAKSRDTEVIVKIGQKDKLLHDILIAGADKANVQIKALKTVEGFVFLSDLRSDMGEVDVKDDKAVDAIIAVWKKDFGFLPKEAVDDLNVNFGNVVKALQALQFKSAFIIHRFRS